MISSTDISPEREAPGRDAVGRSERRGAGVAAALDRRGPGRGLRGPSGGCSARRRALGVGGDGAWATRTGRALGQRVDVLRDALA